LRLDLFLSEKRVLSCLNQKNDFSSSLHNSTQKQLGRVSNHLALMKKLKKRSIKLSSNKNAPQSPRAYIRSGMGKKLPIYRCAIGSDWEEIGKGHVYVARQHTSGNVTVAFFLIDFYCLGVKDAFYKFNVPLYEFEELYDSSPHPLTEISANTAFNMIYEAVDFAAQAGLSPHKDFALVKHLIDDEDDIEYEKIAVGRDGVHTLILDDNENRSKEIATMRKTLGEGNFNVYHISDDIVDDLMVSKSFEEILEGDELDIYHTYLNNIERMDVVALESASPSDDDWYEITDEPISIGKDDFVHPDFEELHDLCLNSPFGAIRRVEKELKKYPDYKPLYNFMAAAYSRTRKKSKAMKYAKLTVEKFPDYLFGYTSFVTLLLQKGELEEAESVLDGKHTLKQFYPDRTEFHISEFLSLQIMLCQMAMAKKEYHKAFLHIQALYKEDKLGDHQITAALKMLDEVILGMYKELKKAGKLPKGIKKPLF
jgi:tetratricopeptide (TPR) repeat protein